MAYLPTAGPAALVRAALALVPLAALTVIGGCDSFLTSQDESPLEVTYTDPDEAEQGDTVSVKIFGDGFVEGDIVSWDVGVFWRVRTDGTYDDPVVLDARGGVAFADGINDSGWIVGHTSTPRTANPPVAVVWHPDDYSSAIPLGSQTSSGAYAHGINNDFQVVGVRMGNEFKPAIPFPGGTEQATLWELDSQGRTTHVVPLLPAPGYSDSRAKTINADGWVVGLSMVVENNSGWVYDGTIWRPDQ